MLYLVILVLYLYSSINIRFYTLHEPEVSFPCGSVFISLMSRTLRAGQAMHALYACTREINGLDRKIRRISERVWLVNYYHTLATRRLDGVLIVYKEFRVILAG